MVSVVLPAVLPAVQQAQSVVAQWAVLPEAVQAVAALEAQPEV